MAIARLDYLYERCMKGIATADERQEFHSLVQLPENEIRLRELLQQAYREPKETIDMDADASHAILQAIFHATAKAASPVPVHRIHFVRRWWAVAAMLLLLLGSGSYLWLFRKRTADIAVTPASHTPEIQPGGNKAVLTLANGNKIILDSAANGIVTKQGRMHIVKLADGKLQYKGTDNSSSLNTLATPYGGQYRLTLSDGTVVWLNAASSITYPTAFTGARREVTVRGEAYFEVMKDAATPFIVNVNDKTEIEVLGTHFNVNAYENEDSISTTLLEGSVKVTAGRAGDKDRPVILRPGQQMQVDGNHRQIKVLNSVDPDRVIAWKNGLFNFEGMPLERAMRQLARWYDIQVVYEQPVRAIRFGGTLKRNLPLSEILHFLEGAGLHYRLENKNRLVILNN